MSTITINNKTDIQVVLPFSFSKVAENYLKPATAHLSPFHPFQDLGKWFEVGFDIQYLCFICYFVPYLQSLRDHKVMITSTSFPIVRTGNNAAISWDVLKKRLQSIFKVYVRSDGSTEFSTSTVVFIVSMIFFSQCSLLCKLAFCSLVVVIF